MKTHKWYKNVVWFLLLIIGFVACEDILEKIDTVNITVKEEFIADEQVNADTTSIPLVPNGRIKGGGGMAKVTEFGFIEVEMAIADAALFFKVLNETGASFSGTIRNNATNDVEFSIYISDVSGLTDPLNDATEITTVTLTSLATYSLGDLTGIAVPLLAFFINFVDIDVVYFYLTVNGTPTADVTIEDMRFCMDASIRLTEEITSGNYAQYADKLDKVQSGEITGQVTNGGTADVTLEIYVSLDVDGFDPNDGVIVMAATNRPDVLDPALLRPGRFDRRIIVDRPDVRGRFEILIVHTRNKPLAEDVDLNIIAKSTPGLVGADLENIVNEAALLAARKDKEVIENIDIEEAVDKVMMGLERKSLTISKEERRVSAYHEAGHALVSLFLPGSDPIHKVSIIPRGMALGITYFLPQDDRKLYSKGYMKSKLVHLLGGRAAEILVFNDPTTGAGNDLKQATEIAHRMVAEWGMSEKLGPINFSEGSQEVFLGKEIISRSKLSEETSKLIDEEVKQFIFEAQDKALEILGDNMDKLKTLAEKLLEQEVITGEEIRDILKMKLPQNEIQNKESS